MNADLAEARALADNLDETLAEHGETACPPVCWVGSMAAEMIRSLAADLGRVNALLLRLTALPDDWDAESAENSRRTLTARTATVDYARGHEYGWKWAGEMLRAALEGTTE